MPEGVNAYADEVYAKAAANFDRLIEKAPLIVEDEPSFYLYRLVMAGRAQTGLVALCSVDEYDNDTIRKHERTRKDKEDDRTRHMLAIGTQTGPVFLTHRPNATVKELSRRIMSTETLFDFIVPDEVVHTTWRAPWKMNPELSKPSARFRRSTSPTATTAPRARAAPARRCALKISLTPATRITTFSSA